MINIGDSIYPQLFLMNARGCVWLIYIRLPSLYRWLMLRCTKTTKCVVYQFVFYSLGKFESRDIILDTIDDPNIPIAGFVLLWWVVKFHVTKGTNQKNSSRLYEAEKQH